MKKIAISFILISLLAVLFTGCQSSAVTTRTVSTTEAATEASTEAPTEAPTEVEAVPDVANQNSEFTPVSTGTQVQVHVATVDEFLSAIAPDTEIILDAEFYDLSTATGYGTSSTAYYRWDEEFDGVQLTILNVSNLTIRAEGDDITAHTISAVPRYANVILFQNCSNVTIEGFTAGHTEEPGSCSGGVICMRNCKDMLVRRCGLYGCGIIGVWADSTQNIQVVDCDIYECSQYGIRTDSCQDIICTGNYIHDIGEEFNGEWYDGIDYLLNATTQITINGEEKPDNFSGSVEE